MTLHQAADAAITALGGPTAVQSALADRGISISLSAVCQWRRRGVPPDRAADLAEMLGWTYRQVRPASSGPEQPTHDANMARDHVASDANFTADLRGRVKRKDDR